MCRLFSRLKRLPYILLLGQKKVEEAIDHFTQTLHPEDENTPGFMYTLAMAYARGDRYQEALHYAREARKRATQFGQSELLASIDKNLELLEQAVSSP